MSAGQPNWQRLAQLGKLPKDQYSKIPMFDQLCDECKKKIMGDKIVEDDNKKESYFKAECEVEGCGWIGRADSEGKANNLLRLHNRKHDNK